MVTAEQAQMIYGTNTASTDGGRVIPPTEGIRYYIVATANVNKLYVEIKIDWKPE